MLKRLAQAWGFASILLLPDYIDLTSQAGDARMRVPWPLTRIALAHLTDMAIVALAFALVMAALRRLHAWPGIRWCLGALLPALLFVRSLNVIPFDIPGWMVASLCLLWFAVVILLVARFHTAAEWLRKAGSALLTGFAVFAMVMTLQLVRAAIWKPGPQAFAHPIPTPPANKQRLVWILFDELAYKYTFETRDPSLHLPAFDRLRQMSTLYTNVTPIAYRTTHVVPGLMLGRDVTDVEYTPDDEYLVRIDSGSWQQFNPYASLFGMASRRGLTTSIVGWYIAYCPVFARVATECYWSNEDAQDRGPTSLKASFASNVWFPLRIMVEQLVRPGRAWADVDRWNADDHINSVKDVSQHALQTLATSQADILYLHIPSPHPPEFWNRRTARFATGGSYLDSLDYTDRLLGRMLDTLEKQPRWASTMLIVQGDHSWRTKMWRPLPGWSAEDERISHGGQWDPRPLLVIHDPGQSRPGTVVAPTSIMHVHDAVAAEIKAIAR
jgi:Sulfatase